MGESRQIYSVRISTHFWYLELLEVDIGGHLWHLVLQNKKPNLANNSNYYRLSNYKDYVDSINNDEMKTLANKYFNTENYVKVVLYPENQ